MTRRIGNLFAFSFLLLLFGAFVQVTHAQSSNKLDDLVEVAVPDRIATGFRFTEGPVWHPAGYLLFSDIYGNSIYKWTPDGQVSIVRSPSGDANGLTLDMQGRLISCEQSNRQVSLTESDSRIVTLASRYEGKRLNCPNDVVVKSDGCVYFTDPPYGSKIELTFAGVYRILPDQNGLELLVRDIPTPNGLAFSPDEKVLYISNTDGMNILAFDVLPNGSLANRRVFITIVGSPDGMKVDIKGNLYVAANMSAVSVYDNKGRHIGDIAVPEATTNCTFGGPDKRTLFITAGKSVYRVKMKVEGVATRESR